MSFFGTGKHSISVSVRELVEHAHRSGDLDLISFSREYSADPIRIHQMIQRQRPGEYTSELAVSGVFEEDDFVLEINGRIDGVYTYPDHVIIDEIKTTAEDPEIPAARRIPAHWSQAKCYAYLYAQDHDLVHVTVQLTYCNMESRAIAETSEDFALSDLRKFFDGLVSGYLHWARTLTSWRETRDGSINSLAFPFVQFRPGQRSIADHVHTALKDRCQVLVQAPTGIGKTVAALFPAIKALGDGLAEKIFFLTARSTGKLSAENALAAMRKQGLRLKSIILTAKDKICPFPESMCTPAECQHARGHYDRVNRAIEDAFTHDSLTHELISDLARLHNVCPFEFSLDLCLQADCIICDYNYVFDPRVYLRRFFAEEHQNHALIIDEAHNLVDRARDMFSAEMDKLTVLEMRRTLRNRLPRIYRILGKINGAFLKMMKECKGRNGDFHARELPPDLNAHLLEFVFAARRWLAENRKTPYRKKLIELYSSAHFFLMISELYDSRYVTCYANEDRNLKIKLFCIDPSKDMAAALNRGACAVFLSATLVPMDYFMKILGCQSSARTFTLPSPFPRENFGVVVAPGISTLYRNREISKSAVVGMLVSLVRAKPGNYIFYFPSYAYLNLILHLFSSQAPHIPTIVQQPGFSEDERISFLGHFRTGNSNTLAGFAVMGGVFGEGIDLVGDRLTGAAVIGVGLPGMSTERDCIRDYFSEHGNEGFEFAYQYPGINRVLQAAGRVIRSEHDRGVVLFIDQRFGTMRYRRLLPEDWQVRHVYSVEQLSDRLGDFWNQGR